MFGSEAADAVQAEAEDEAVFVADAYVECIVLERERAAIVGVADCVERADKRRLPSSAAIFEIEEQRCSPVDAFITVADENGRTPLRAANRAGLLAVRVCVLSERRDEVDGPRVVKSLK